MLSFTVGGAVEQDQTSKWNLGPQLLHTQLCQGDAASVD